MNKLIKVAISISLFFLIFLIFLIVSLPIIITLNVVAFRLLSVSKVVNDNLIVAVSFVNDIFLDITSTWNQFVTFFNSVSTLLPSIFTLWNDIYRAIELIINLIVSTYCPGGITTCQSEILGSLFIDIFNVFVDIFGFFSDILTSIRTSIEFVICDAGISNIIGHTPSIKCASPPLGITDILDWISSLIKWIFEGFPELTEMIRTAACEWTGECGLNLVLLAPVGYRNPHNFPTDVPAVANVYEIISRILFRPAIIKNILIGGLWNILAVPADSALCLLRPINFRNCIWAQVCDSIVEPFILPIFSGFDLDGPIGPLPPIPPIQLLLDLGNFLCDVSGTCPCFRCSNIFGLRGPCVISNTCSPCTAEDTVLDQFGDALGLIDPSLATSPPPNPFTFNHNIQNQIV